MTEEELLRKIEQALNEGAIELDLSNALLSYLPPEISQLTSLQSLDLRGNQLSTLPGEIKLQLPNLKVLRLKEYSYFYLG